jgi:hypothetical protein
MADNITLTVHVRDLTDAGFRAVNARLRRFQARLEDASRRTHFDGLTRSLNRFGQRMNHIGSRQYFTRLRRSLLGVRDHLVIASAAGGPFRHMLLGMARSVDVVQRGFGRLSRTFTHSVRSVGRGFGALSRLSERMGRGVSRGFALAARGVGSLRRGLERMRRATQTLIGGFDSLLGAMKKHPIVATILIGIWKLLVTLAPVLAGLLTVTLAGAFIALGAYALKGTQSVKNAFTQMKTSVASDIKAAAAPLAPYLVAGMRQVSRAMKDLRPALTKTFSLVGPLVQPLVAAITGFVAKAMPGFNAALSRAMPIMEGFRGMMESIGKGLGDMFDKMTSGSATQIGEALQIFGDGIENILVALGQLFGTIAKTDGALNSLKNTLRFVELFIRTLGPAIQMLETAMYPFEKIIRGVQIGWDALLSGFSTGSSTVKELGSVHHSTTLAVDATTAAEQNLAAALQKANTEIGKQNDLQTSALGGQIGFEQAIDDAAKAVHTYTGKLKIHNGILDVNKQADRDVADALNNLASQTNKYGQDLVNLKAPQDKINAAYARGRKQLEDLAVSAGLSREAARKLANTLIQTPDVTANVRANITDLESKLSKARGDLKKTADTKAQAKIRANIKDLQSKLAAARRQLDALNGKTVTTYAVTEYRIKGKSFLGSTAGRYATGGQVKGPGSGTSDSIPILASNGEYVINARSAKKYRLLLDALNRGKISAFARGGGITSSMRQARAEAAGSFSISHFGQMAGYRTNAFEKSLAAAGSIGELASALNQWAATIRNATSGATEKRLLRALDSAAKKLMKYERAHEKVTAALEAAKTKLNDLKDASTQLRDNIKTSIMSAANITTAASASEGPVTTTGILNQLTMNRDQAKAFADALATLKQRGLNAQSLSEIAQAGVEGGGLETASALLRASPSDIKQINELQRQIAKSAEAAGKTTADAMYAAGIRAAEGLVKGLEKQKKSLEKLMESIAKALEKSIKKAFGLKANGGPIGAAGGGARGGQVTVGEQGPEIVRLPFGSTVRTNADSRRIAGAYRSDRGDPMVINLYLGSKKFAELLVDPLRNVVRTRGGNVQAVLGQ